MFLLSSRQVQSPIASPIAFFQSKWLYGHIGQCNKRWL